MNKVTKKKADKLKKQPKWSWGYWLYFVEEHSLTIVLAILTLALKITSALLPQGYWQDSLNGLGDDAWGAFLIILCTKYFIERGSPASR